MHVKGGFLLITLYDGQIPMHKFFKEDLVNSSTPDRPTIGAPDVAYASKLCRGSGMYTFLNAS